MVYYYYNRNCIPTVHESFEKVSEPFLIHTHTHITYAGSLKMKVRKEGKEEAQMEVEDLRLV